MKIIQPWIIRRVQTMHDGHEVLGEQEFQLVKNENEVIASFNITDIRKVKDVFEFWEDPYKAKPHIPPESLKMKIGDKVRKMRGSDWSGTIVGHYSTRTTPIGWVVESDKHYGSCQIYPEDALELI